MKRNLHPGERVIVLNDSYSTYSPKHAKYFNLPYGPELDLPIVDKEDKEDKSAAGENSKALSRIDSRIKPGTVLTVVGHIEGNKDIYWVDTRPLGIFVNNEPITEVSYHRCFLDPLPALAQLAEAAREIKDV